MNREIKHVRHPWTHRSAFQKITDYGNVDLEECIVSSTNAYVGDSDDELSDSGRARKRRRIEQLADNFLSGEPLFISSARPCPQALRRTLVWHKKSLTEPGFVLPEIGTSMETPGVWKDVESDAQILKRLAQSSRSRKNTAMDVDASPQEHAADIQHVGKESAQAGCNLQRRLRTVNLSAEPSEDAFRQSAALRNRKTTVAPTEMAVIAEELTHIDTPAYDASVSVMLPQSDQILCNQQHTREWLSRRKSRFSFGGGGGDDEADEAGSPCIAPSSPPPRSPQPSVFNLPVNPLGTAKSLEHNTEQHSEEHNASYHTAAEQGEVFAEPIEAPQVERQLASAGEPQPESDQTRPTYLQAPSTQNGTTPLMYRKRAPRSRTMDRDQGAASTSICRRSARRNVTFPSSEGNHPPVQVPQSASQQHVASHPPVLEMSFQSDYSFAPKLNMALVEEHQNSILPIEPTSTGRTSFVKKALRRELRDSGAEITRCGSEPPPSSQIEEGQPQPAARPPSDRGASHNASGTSDSQRRQTWLGTQAMVARAERELFVSPEKPRSTFTPINEQTSVSSLGQTSHHTPRSEEREPLKRLWQEPAPSTQALLDNFGGFSTIKKPRGPAMLNKATEPTPVATEKGKRPESRVVAEAGRSSLNTSSTSDKAKENKGSGFPCSISSFDSASASAPPNNGLGQRADADEALNTSTVSLATPAPSSPNRSARPSSMKPSSARSAPPPQHSQPQSSGADKMFGEYTFVSADFPSLHQTYQAAHAPEALPADLLRDLSNMSQTIDDLTRDVLETTRDVEGVVSR